MTHKYIHWRKLDVSASNNVRYSRIYNHLGALLSNVRRQGTHQAWTFVISCSLYGIFWTVSQDMLIDYLVYSQSPVIRQHVLKTSNDFLSGSGCRSSRPWIVFKTFSLFFLISAAHFCLLDKAWALYIMYQLC